MLHKTMVSAHTYSAARSEIKRDFAFAMPSKKHPEISKKKGAEDTQRTLREVTENTQRTHREHTENTEKHRQHTEKHRGTYKEA